MAVINHMWHVLVQNSSLHIFKLLILNYLNPGIDFAFLIIKRISPKFRFLLIRINRSGNADFFICFRLYETATFVDQFIQSYNHSR